MLSRPAKHESNYCNYYSCFYHTVSLLFCSYFLVLPVLPCSSVCCLGSASLGVIDNPHLCSASAPANPKLISHCVQLCTISPVCIYRLSSPVVSICLVLLSASTVVPVSSSLRLVNFQQLPL